MINRVKNRYLKAGTKSLLYSLRGCKHAIYGICYSTPKGHIVEELADNPHEAKFFYDEVSFNNCIDAIYTKYNSCGCYNLNIYCVHRAE